MDINNMLFDTHAHYDDNRFDGDRDELLGQLADDGVGLVVNVSSSVESCEASVALAERYPFIYAAVGVHPHDAKHVNDDVIENMGRLLRHPKAVAVGEIGLDYHYDLSPRDVQRRRFRDQLELARAVGKPVIIHEREALDDVVDIIGQCADGLTGVFHCFSGDWEIAKIILDLGWYLSYTGIITFKSARRALETAAKVPSDRIMLETDCPYLSPEPVRGGRNSSKKLIHIARALAGARGVDIDELSAVTTENGRRFFKIT
jgi:TatD DNase family protein